MPTVTITATLDPQFEALSYEMTDSYIRPEYQTVPFNMSALELTDYFDSDIDHHGSCDRSTRVLLEVIFVMRDGSSVPFYMWILVFHFICGSW